MQLSLLLPVKDVLLCLPKLRISLRFRKTQAQVILVDGSIFEYPGGLEILDSPSRAPHYYRPIDVFLSNVHDNALDTLDAGTPAADETQENVVGDIGAEFALPHVVMQF